MESGPGARGPPGSGGGRRLSLEIITAGTWLPALAQAGGVGALGAPAPGGEIDFSVLGLFLKATLTVQVTMVLLLLASFWSWAIIVEKALAYRRLRRDAAAFEADFWSGASLEDLFERIGPAPETPSERVFAAGMVEWNRSLVPGAGVIPGTQGRVERAMSVAIAREGEAMTRRLAFLATTGAVAPFVGLFGTVWGIMNSFQGIAQTGDANLAVVAPGIAEALFATAIGLVAAIPAVVGYNRYTAALNSYITRVEGFTGEFTAILSRQADGGR